MLLYFDNKNIVKFASTKPIITNVYKSVEVKGWLTNPIGKKVVFKNRQPSGKMRVAVICNWDDACGIATYSKYLIDALTPKVDSLKIFSEKTKSEKLDSRYDVSYCWSRGEPMRHAIEQVLRWQPSVVLIQHEFGIFPKAGYLLQMFQMLHDTPHVVTMHSVYEHLDKTVSSSAMRNIIVHTESGRSCLQRIGNKNRVWVVPHGCVNFDNVSELWNTWQTPYPIIQFGFGFTYKGVEIALEAVSLLKKKQPTKYADVFYTYFCSENDHVKNINNGYARKIQATIDSLGLQDNAAVVRGYQSEQTLNNCLRTGKLAIFPYLTDPKNVVYGASGAVRIAMANGIPVIASSSRMFDDMDGILPRPDGPEQLAECIDRVFSNGEYRQGLVGRSLSYVKDNSWNVTADRYLSILQQVMEKSDEDVIFV